MKSASEAPCGKAREPAEGDSAALSVRVGRGALWVAASNLLLRLASVSSTAFIAHILSPRDFGIFAAATAAYSILYTLGELGVTSCLMRADLDIDCVAPAAAVFSILSSLVFAGALTIFAGPIASALGSAGAAASMRVMALALLLGGAVAVPMAHLVREFRQREICLANFAGCAFSIATLFSLAGEGLGAISFAWSTVLGQIVSGCIVTVAASRRYRPRFSRSGVSVILRFGVPLAGANFVHTILLNVDYAFVGHIFGAAELGLYVMAFNVASWPGSLLAALINNMSIPTFSRVKNDPVLLRKATVTALRGTSLIVLPISAITAALAHPLIVTLYGSRWAAAANALTMLSFYGAAFTVCLLIANLIAAMGAVRSLLAVQLIWICCLVPAMLVGARTDGFVGVAYAHVAVIFPIVVPGYLLILKRCTRVGAAALAKAVLPAFLASSAVAVAAHVAAAQLSNPRGQFAAGLAAGGVVYAMCAGPHAVTTLGRGRTVARIMRFLPVRFG